MTNTLIFVRHAKTLVDKNKPIEKWILTDEGQKDARKLTDEEILNKAEVIISSEEDKSYMTIKPLADKLNKKVIKIIDLGEIKRPNSEKLTSAQYEAMKKKIFEDREYTELGWETANHALGRFKRSVEKINNTYNNKKIVICSHGTVMSLYFAYLSNNLDKLLSRWKNLDFGSYGIVENNKVIKDIVAE
jgi:2,3-bisphosphoglycerate-dependent phosphoglycerate mutase